MGLLITALPAVSPLPARAEGGSVIISEINWAGSEKSSADEWIEIANLGSTDVDLSGWKIEGAATSGQALAIPEGTVIKAKDVIVIANYDIGDKSTLAVSPAVVTTAISLANSNLALQLVDRGGNVRDNVNDAGMPDFGSTSPFTSMERDLVTMSWKSAVASTGLTALTQFGTPAYATWPVVEANTTADELIDETSNSADLIVGDAQTTNNETDSTQNDTEIETTSADSETSTTPEITDVPIDQPADTSPAVETPVASTDTENDAPVTTTPTTDTVEDESPTAVQGLSVEEIIESTDNTSSPNNTAVEIETSAENPSTNSAVSESQTAPTDASTGNDDGASGAPENGDATSTTAAPTPFARGTLLITEVVASPAAGDEWIEITNMSSGTVDTNGWIIKEGGGKETALPVTMLAPEASLTVSPITGNLNNSGDSITLFDPLLTIIDDITYGPNHLPVPAKGEALVRFGDGWHTSTTMTPGAANPAPIIYDNVPATENYTPHTTPVNPQASQDAVGQTVQNVTGGNSVSQTAQQTSGTAQGNIVNTTPATGSAPTGDQKPKTTTKKTSAAKKTTAKKATTKKASTKTTYLTVTISELTALPDKTKVEVEGIIIAAPGTIGATTMYLDGLEIVLPSKAGLPILTVGQRVTLRGALEKSADGVRVRLHKAQPFAVHDDAVPIAAGAITGAKHATLVVAKGTVIERNGATFSMTTENGTVLVRAPKALTAMLPTSTADVTVTGVMRVKDGVTEILLRDKSDLIIDAQGITLPATKHRPWVPVGLLTGSIGVLGTWFTSGRKIISLLH